MEKLSKLIAHYLTNMKSVIFIAMIGFQIANAKEYALSDLKSFSARMGISNSSLIGGSFRNSEKLNGSFHITDDSITIKINSEKFIFTGHDKKKFMMGLPVINSKNQVITSYSNTKSESLILVIQDNDLEKKIATIATFQIRRIQPVNK